MTADAITYCPRCGSRLVSRSLEGVLRKTCTSDCGFVFWDNPTPVVAVVVVRDGELVLARNHAWPRGQFSLVTGFLERGEAPAQAAARELKEELNLDCAALEFIGHYVLAAHNQLLLAFCAQAQGALALSAEIAEVKCVSVSEITPAHFGAFILSAQIVDDWRRRGGRGGTAEPA